MFYLSRDSYSYSYSYSCTYPFPYYHSDSYFSSMLCPCSSGGHPAASLGTSSAAYQES